MARRVLELTADEIDLVKDALRSRASHLRSLAHDQGSSVSPETRSKWLAAACDYGTLAWRLGLEPAERR